MKSVARFIGGSGISRLLREDDIAGFHYRTTPHFTAVDLHEHVLARQGGVVLQGVAISGDVLGRTVLECAPSVAPEPAFIGLSRSKAEASDHEPRRPDGAIGFDPRVERPINLHA